MIKLEKVNKFFYRHKKNQIHVINNTSIDFGDSGLVALLGPSGCGKTTLLNTIGGLDKVSNGKIYINGKRITRRSSNYIDKVRNLNIGYIFQDYCLVDNMSVYDNVALVLKINGIKNKEEINKRVNYVLEKVGMYRYRNRYASMLSGGERQRVGIARAIVKEPSIIIADEPTGNLDSRNSLEVMNIIKAISKNRLVILVTHETDLAEFYASRILDINDGQIVNDRKNEHTNDLDYRLDSKIYLKDFKNHHSLEKENVKIDYYSDDIEKLDIDIVVQNGNIYIKTKSLEQLEIIDDDSSIELVDDHYKKINKTIYEEYDFDFEKFADTQVKKRYSSIFNPISLLINGFKKIRDYTLIKKVLLAGFFASGAFILNSLSNALGITNIKDEEFINVNRNYLNIVSRNIKVDDYLNYEKQEDVEYILPGNSSVSFNMSFKEYYQTSQMNINLIGSLVSIDSITKDDIVKGKYPENRYEIVLDRLTINRLFNNNIPKQAGIINEDYLLNKTITINNMPEFIIVGIVDKKDPSIYTNPSNFTNILYYSSSNGSYYDSFEVSKAEDNSIFVDYELVSNDVSLVKGRWPTNPYEAVIHNDLKDQYKINKQIEDKINDQKLTVVGYYTSSKNINKNLVSNETIKYDLIKKSQDITIYPKDKEKVLRHFQEINVNIEDKYVKDRDKYINNMKDTIITSVIVSSVILLISLIEIYLMIRSSFLSRIKEVGIFRAIGMKKKDIRKMFLGEIIAITTIASLTGVLFSAYVITQLKNVSYFSDSYLINSNIVIGTIIFVYLFNIFVGLLPVNKTLRQTPAKILSRSDLE